MAFLYKAVNVTNELKRQAILQELLNLGVTEYKGKPVRDLNYYEVRHVLAMERINKRNLTGRGNEV